MIKTFNISIVLYIIFFILSNHVTISDSVWPGDGLDFYAPGPPFDRYSWDWVFAAPQTWPATHVVNPFIIDLMLQNSLLTMAIVTSWESFEVLLVLIFKNTYGIFLDKPAPEGEPIADSAIGDVFGGIIGILLSWLFQFVFKMPPWCPSFFGPHRDVFMKHFLVVLVNQIVFWAANLEFTMKNSPPFKAGALAIMLFEFIVYLVVKKSFFSNKEILLYWRDRTYEYELVQVGWFLIFTLIMGQSLYFVTYSYFQLWYTCILIFVFMMVLIQYDNRMWEFWFGITLGHFRRDFYNTQQIRLNPNIDAETYYWYFFLKKYAAEPIKVRLL